LNGPISNFRALENAFRIRFFLALLSSLLTPIRTLLSLYRGSHQFIPLHDVMVVWAKPPYKRNERLPVSRLPLAVAPMKFMVSAPVLPDLDKVYSRAGEQRITFRL
jgi:hypothetical protein